MRIKFLKSVEYKQNDPQNSREYKAGEEYEVSDDHGSRWIRRQVAVEVPKRKPAEPKPEPKPEPKAEPKPLEVKGK